MKRLASAVLALYKREPARANAVAAAALSWLALRVGLDVDDATVLLLATSGLSLAAGEVTRWLVVPTATVDRVIADEVRDIEAPQYAEGGYVVGPLPIVGEGSWQPANPNVHVRSDK